MEIKSIDTFLAYSDSVRRRTLRVIEKIPQEKIDWKPHETAFSFGDIIRHISTIEFNMFGRNVQHLESAYPGHEIGGVTKHEVLDYMSQEHQKLKEVVSKLTQHDLQKKCVTAAGVKITIWKWLRSMIEHEIHHRGQIYAYLKLLEVESPPLYGLTSEQVRENSIDLP